MSPRCLLFPLVLLCLPHAVHAAEDAGISELLTWTAEAPDWQEHLKRRMSEGWKPPARVSSTPDQRDDLATLIDHWKSHPYGHREEKPDAATRERLLKACEEQPAVFESVGFRFEPADAGVPQRIQQLYQRMPATSEEEKKAKAKARDWLMCEAGLLRPELKQEAEAAFQHALERTRRSYLDAFLRHEPAEGEKLLLQHAQDTEPASRLLALLRLFDQDAARWRSGIQKLVESNAAPALRIEALKALAAKRWPGSDAWLLGLFKHAELGYLSEDYHSSEPFAEIIKAAPDVWIPRVIQLVGNKDRAVHDNAVRCLAQFHLSETREDALKPLLPWLTNPAWALDPEHDGRLRLIQSLAQISLPQSVPGLIYVLEHDSGYWRSAAADALAHYKAREAVPALRKALLVENDAHHQRSIASAMLKLNVFSSEELVEGIESLVEQTLTEEKRSALSALSDPFAPSEMPKLPRPLLARIAIGQCTHDLDADLREGVAKTLLQRTKALRPKNSALADALELHISDWETPANHELLRQRLLSGNLSAEWVWRLLESAPTIENAPPVSQAIIAVAHRDGKAAAKMLADPHADAQAMLLACARLKRLVLPVKEVQSLLASKHILVKRAALLYLEALDTAEARELVWSHFPGEARILGARMGYDPGHFSFRGLDQWEDVLRQRVLAPGGADEIHALLSAGYWGNAGQLWIEKRPDGAWLVNAEDRGRQRVRKISQDEYAELLRYLKEHQVDELPTFDTGTQDGLQLEHVHLTRNGGKRVFMNNPDSGADGAPEVVYENLVTIYRDLIRDTSRLSVEYRGVSDVTIEIAAEKMPVKAVWGRAGQLFVHARLPGTQRDRWCQLDGTPAQGEFPSIVDPCDAGSDSHLQKAAWLSNGIRVGDHPQTKKSGLWHEKGEWISDGVFADPVVSADGKVVVVSRARGKHWGEPNDVVRIELGTKKVLPIDLPSADDFSVITRLPDTGKILLFRSRNEPVPGIKPKEGPQKPEYHLLEASTGELERVKGEFQPLHDETWRPLQNTAKQGIVWAALPSMEKGRQTGTLIGRYDLSSFHFETFMKVPVLQFSSMDFWVEESKKRVWIVVNNDLLSLPMAD
ncbi:MAG TPA: hypothetical protein DIT13_02910 [Verrucomicrobiales bacterium]|nr:hypothetical protein [Verrucomicrobiales bacterium]HRK14521.1 HEAT repeat domain-containing protein [Prosthecobacter sp.]